MSSPLMQSSGQTANHSIARKWEALEFLEELPDVSVCLLLIRRMIQRVQRGEERKFKAKMMSERVQWHFQRDNNSMEAFDLDTNLLLEEALDNKQQKVKIKISNKPYHADLERRTAMSADGHKVVELQRKDMKGQCAPLQNPFHVNMWSH